MLSRWVVAKMSDNKWHVFDRETGAEVTLRGMSRKCDAKAIAASME